MSSIVKTTKRSKKTLRLGPVQVVQPDQYEAFDVGKKVECIRALITLSLLLIQAFLEEAVCTLVGPATHGKPCRCLVGGMGVIPAVSAWRASRSPCGFREFAKPLGDPKFR